MEENEESPSWKEAVRITEDADQSKRRMQEWESSMLHGGISREIAVQFF
jgi:hypothetical protein